MKRAFSTVLALAVCSIIAVTAAIAAENVHAYSGSYCKARFGKESADFYHQFNGIWNANEEEARLISCPVTSALMVDESQNTSVSTRVRVQWQASASAPGDTIRCTLYSMNGDGSVRDEKSASKTGGGEFFIPKVIKDDVYGHYSMTCRLPGHGYLISIWVEEQTEGRSSVF